MSDPVSARPEVGEELLSGAKAGRDSPWRRLSAAPAAVWRAPGRTGRARSQVERVLPIGSPSRPPSHPAARSPEPEPEPYSRLGIRLGNLRPHFRLGLHVICRAGSAVKCIRPGNCSLCEGPEGCRNSVRGGPTLRAGTESVLAVWAWRRLECSDIFPGAEAAGAGRAAGALENSLTQGDPIKLWRCAGSKPSLPAGRGRGEPKPQELLGPRLILAGGGRAGAKRGNQARSG